MKAVRSEQGFYLVEQLVVIVVLGMMVIPFFLMFSAGAQSNAQERMYSVAVGLAREKMEEVKNRGFCNASGEFEPEVERFAAFTRAVDVDLVSDDLKLVTVVVSWPFKNETREYRLVSYLARR
ncbi:MAG: type II secretion system protein [Dethiobacter sp.]|jgi:type II secretory pathway pseudopilin PulG|nr:type II secretion system protein [Dethiobacter sp.]